MRGLAAWIKQNKLSSFLLLILGFFALRGLLLSAEGVSLSTPMYQKSASFEMGAPAASRSISNIVAPGGGRADYYPSNPAPPTDAKTRMVVQNSYLSLVVRSVSDTMGKIKFIAASVGGYMVNSNIDNPQENTSGSITLRIPADKLDETLNRFRGLAVKVASERLDGTDVTDQYVDNEAKLAVLNSNMARFKEIMGQAKEVSDILSIQQQIFSLQDQIDQIKGSNKYMEQTAKLSLVTIYLSTDEYTLPYAPAEPWRPEIIFKSAVRSLIGVFRSIATLIIWVAVFSLIWLPIVLLILYLRKRGRRNRPTP